MNRLLWGLLALSLLWLAGMVLWSPFSGDNSLALSVSEVQESTVASEAPATSSRSDDVANGSVLGSPQERVDQLLEGWRKSSHGAGPRLYKYDNDVQVIVQYNEANIAVGAAALSRGRAISEQRAEELIKLIGTTPYDREFLGRELHGMYFGDIW